MPRKSHYFWFDNSNIIRWRVQVTRILITWFYLATRHFVPLRPEHPLLYDLPLMWETRFHTHVKPDTISYVLIFRPLCLDAREDWMLWSAPQWGKPSRNSLCFLLSKCRGRCEGTVHRPGGDPRKECEECGNARGSNVRYYPTWKHSPLKDHWLLIN
jgi:hypothetical protein